MFQILWEYISPGKWRYTIGEYRMYKKNMRDGSEQYQIYECKGDVQESTDNLIFSTGNERDFMIRARDLTKYVNTRDSGLFFGNGEK